MIHNLRINHDRLYGEDGTQPVSFVLTDRVIDKIKAQNELEMSQTAKTYYEMSVLFLYGLQVFAILLKRWNKIKNNIIVYSKNFTN